VPLVEADEPGQRYDSRLARDLISTIPKKSDATPGGVRQRGPLACGDSRISGYKMLTALAAQRAIDGRGPMRNVAHADVIAAYTDDRSTQTPRRLRRREGGWRARWRGIELGRLCGWCADRLGKAARPMNLALISY
jgi:hypothetical protein